MDINKYSEEVQHKIKEVLTFVNKLPLKNKQRHELLKKIIDQEFTTNKNEKYENKQEDENKKLK